MAAVRGGVAGIVAGALASGSDRFRRRPNHFGRRGVARSKSRSSHRQRRRQKRTTPGTAMVNSVKLTIIRKMPKGIGVIMVTSPTTKSRRASTINKTLTSILTGTAPFLMRLREANVAQCPTEIPRAKARDQPPVFEVVSPFQGLR